MSSREELMKQVSAWLIPLKGEDGPSGPDLEYDNAFLALTKAAEGKADTQFEKATPPDWRSVRSLVGEMFDRTRDLRVAVLWLRSALAVEGLAGLAPGLHLLSALLGEHWDDLHPKPDPSDNDTFARSNALAVLPRMDGVLGNLLSASVANIKGVGDLRMRDLDVALGTTPPRPGEPSFTRDQVSKMLQAAGADGLAVRADMVEAQAQFKALGKVLDQRFGAGSASDLKPLADLVNRTLALAPEPPPEPGAEGDDEGGEAGGGSGARKSSGLSGTVSNRAEAIRAIDLVCEYLERVEPSNPAPLFLRRARVLLERSFLELLKELAPAALNDVAKTVGVDPATVGQTKK